MKKLIALMLSLVMALACIGSAEIQKYTLDLNYMGEQLAQAVLKAGNDEDGCYAAVLEGMLAGESLNALLQIGNSLTFGSGEELYTITPEAVKAAVALALSSALSPEIAEKLMKVDFQADSEAAMGLAMGELNRFMSLAAELGIVTFSETGDVTVIADEKSTIALVSAYIGSLSADADALAALTGLQTWQALELPDAETLKQELTSMVAELAEIDLSELGTTCSLYMHIGADGTMNINANGVTDGEEYGLTLSYYGNGYSYSIKAPGTNAYVNYNLDLETGLISFAEHVEQYSSVMDVVMSFNINSYELSCVYTDSDGASVMVSGALTAQSETELEYTLTVIDGEEVHSLVLGGKLLEKTDSGMVLELYATADGVAYALNIAITGMDAVLTLTENGEAILKLNGGVRINEEEQTVQLYVLHEDGVEYTLTARELTGEMGEEGVILSVDMTQEGVLTNLMTLTLTRSISEESLPHVVGQELSGEEVMQLVGALLESISEYVSFNSYYDYNEISEYDGE